MINIWDKTIHIDEKLAADLINSQTNIVVNSIETIGEGFDNIAFLINKKIVFRFPRRETALELLENEISLLPHIAQKVSYSITSPTYFGKETNAFPYKFLGYPIIEGNVLCEFTKPPIRSHDFAVQFAKALKELHSIKVKPEHNLSKHHDTWRLNTESRYIRMTEYLKKYRDIFIAQNFDIAQLTAIIAKFKQIEFSNAVLSYVHGDLYSKHIIVDNNLNFKGLIDWGDVHVGNPAIDIASALTMFNEETFKIFCQTYENFDLKAAAFRSFCHRMITLAYACEENDKNLLKWSKFSLARSVSIFQELFL